MMRPMKRATFTRTFSAAHRVWNDPGKCQMIHGHNYAAKVDVEIKDGGLTESGFVVPFQAVKDAIDFFDHTLILDEDDPLLTRDSVLNEVVVRTVKGVPSTEFMAAHLAEKVAAAVAVANPSATWGKVTVKLAETASITAYGEAEWPSQ